MDVFVPVETGDYSIVGHVAYGTLEAAKGAVPAGHWHDGTHSGATRDGQGFAAISDFYAIERLTLEAS